MKHAPFFADGFWWWFDPKRGGWFVGTAPQIQRPSWALALHAKLENVPAPDGAGAKPAR